MMELAKLGVRIVVGDVSPRQLGLNRLKGREASCEDAVLIRELLDVVDSSCLPTGHFDAAAPTLP